MTPIHFKESAILLCYLIASSDGINNHFESRMYDFFKSIEDITEQQSDTILAKLKTMSDQMVYEKGIEALNMCSREEQVKCLAWMNKIANSDGRLDDKEWSIIYQVYKKELNLTLEEILAFELPDMDYSF